MKPVVDLLKELNFNYFLYDSSVMYSSLRDNPESHMKVALEKGWGSLGEVRTTDGFVVVKGENMSYEVCKELVDADAVLVLSHFKGHVCAGFGGAIKNLGMGALTKKSKAAIHTGGMPEIVGICKRCRLCEEACPMNFITVTDKPNFKGCLGCSSCIYACPYGVLRPKKNYYDTLLADGASAAQKSFKKYLYVNFIINITKLCDCASNPGKKIAEDVGYIFNNDAVSIDNASRELVNRQEGKDLFLEFNKKSGVEQLEAAQEFGMGEMSYELIHV